MWRTMAATAKRRRRVVLASDPVTDFTVNAGQSSAELSAATVATGATLTLTIIARNAAGQALSGKAITSVTLAPVGSGTVSGSGNTNALGVAIRTITAGDIGAGNTATVVCDAVSITEVPTFDVTAAPSTGFWADDFWAPDFWAAGFWAE